MGIRLAVVLVVLLWQSVAEANVFPVTNTNNAGAGSLRQAIIGANGAQGSNAITISLSAPGTVVLTAPLPVVSFTLTITGPGADQLTIQGDGTAPVFTMNGTVQLSGVTITGGVNNSGNGGGIVLTSGSLVLLDSTITGNSASAGGGIYSTGALTILNSTISNNTGSSAIFAGGETSMIDSTIADNHGTAIVFPTADKTLTIDRSTISGNSSVTGSGGLQLQGGTAVIRNTTFSGNTGDQGGDLGTSSGVELSLLSVTAVGGSAPAFMLAPASTVMLRNTLLVGTGARCSPGSVVTSQGHNLLSDATCNLADSTDKSEVVDPGLGLLMANGGATKTHKPLAHSPALNVGDGAQADSSDQRGKPRIQFGTIDIGAVEVTEPMISTQPAPQSVVEGRPFTLTVVAVNQNSATPLTYTWYNGDAEVVGATSATFTKAAAELADSGTYEVRVSNEGGYLTSTAALVTVTPAVKGDVDNLSVDGGGCCSSSGGGAESSSALALVLALILGFPRRRVR